MRVKSSFILILLALSFSTLTSAGPAPDPLPRDPSILAPFYYDFAGKGAGEIARDWEIGIYDAGPGSSRMSPEGLLPSGEYASLEASLGPEGYRGAQLMSRRFFGLGTFTVRMRSRIVPGTVSSFFLMNEWESGTWLHKEIDVEFLGKDRGRVQFNLHRFTAPAESAAGDPVLVDLGFDCGEAFHEYSIRWTKDSVSWYVDGVKKLERKDKVPDVPLQILANIWLPLPGSGWGEAWLGTLDDSRLPTYADYHCIKYEPEP